MASRPALPRLLPLWTYVVFMLPLPAFATAVVASLAFGAPAAHAANCPGAGQLPLLSTTATAKSATLCLINEQRAAHDRAALRSQSTLEAAATSYARSMVQQRFFAHVSPSGQGLGDRLASYTRGTRSYAMGENLAWGQSVLGTPAATVDSWMHSQGHRDNILNANFDEIGVGIVPGSPRGGALDAGATYVTEFGFRQLAPGASGHRPRPRRSRARAKRSPDEDEEALGQDQAAHRQAVLHRLAPHEVLGQDAPRALLTLQEVPYADGAEGRPQGRRPRAPLTLTRSVQGRGLS